MTPLPALPDDRVTALRTLLDVKRDAKVRRRLHTMHSGPWNALTAIIDEAAAAIEAELADDDFLRALTHGAHADTARLDWLENAENNVEVDARYPNIKSVRIQRAGQPMHTAGSVRAAIDLALAATRSTQGNQV